MTAAALRRLTLTNFRSYHAASLDIGSNLVVLTGPNGAGKTNLIEAISFLMPGRGLRRATLEEVAFSEGDGAAGGGGFFGGSAQGQGMLRLPPLRDRIEPPAAQATPPTRPFALRRQAVSFPARV